MIPNIITLDDCLSAALGGPLRISHLREAQMKGTMAQNANQKCRRCGLCCLETGRTFWKIARSDLSVLRHWPPALLARARDGDYEGGNLPCEMLDNVKQRYVCLLESRYGRRAKPLICRQYPFDGKKCFRQLITSGS